MKNVVLQVPMSKEMKLKAEAVSSELGFSSLQEVVRVFLTKLGKKEMTITVQEQFPAEVVAHLSKSNERIYKKAVKDIKAGRNVTKTKNIDELLKMLHHEG